MVSLSFFLPGRNDPKRREALELDKEAMVGVDERLNKRGYYVPC